QDLTAIPEERNNAVAPLILSRGFRSAASPSCVKMGRTSKNPRGTMNSRRTITFFFVILVAILAALIVWPRAVMTRQDQARQNQQMPTIDEYQPKSTLVTKEHKIERAKFPFLRNGGKVLVSGSAEWWGR